MSTPGTRDAGLSTGEFGRRCGLSHKALRLYDMSGLLPPAQVDPLTGHRRYAAGQLAPDLPVRLRDVPEAKVAAIRRDVDQPALVPMMQAAEDELRRHLRAGGAEPTGELWVIYHGQVTPDSEAPVEVCVPFTGTVDPAGPIVIRVEPARTEAYATIARDDCHYPGIMLGYDAVGAWVLRTGQARAGAPREVYFAAWEDTGGTEDFCHVAQPIEGTTR